MTAEAASGALRDWLISAQHVAPVRTDFGRRLEANVWTMLAVKPPAHLAHRGREHRTADTQFYKPHPVLQKVLQTHCI